MLGAMIANQTHCGIWQLSMHEDSIALMLLERALINLNYRGGAQDGAFT